MNSTLLPRLVALAALVLAPGASAQVFDLDLLWYRFADPGGGNAQGRVGPGDGFETDRRIVNGESAEFSPDGQLIVTTSKADGRLGQYPTGNLTGGTAHLRLWDLDGTLIWDRGRSRGPDNNGDGRPDDQPGDGEDEIEIAVFTKDGNYVAAGGEDNLVEVWQVRDLQTGAVLASPVLVRTLTEAGAAYDALRFSNSGELLFGGTEERGKIEIWRTTGPPETWEHVGEAVHGGSAIGKAVNSMDTSSDDRYLVSAGTDTNGGFWRINTTRGANGQITSVTLDRLATMRQPIRSAKAARFESVTDRHVVIASKDQRMFVYDTERLKTGDTTPVTVLSNSLYNGVDGLPGVEIEPGDYSTDGRFLVNGGGPEENIPANSAGYQSSFFRVFETAEIQAGAPEPDPVYVQPAFHTEHFHFRAGDDRLTTAHEDGTVRLWDVTTTGEVTVASEGFNERSETHGRWTLSGPLATPGDNEWGITAGPANPEIGEPSVITQDSKWVGHRGSRYLGADNLGGQLHRLTLNATWDASAFSGLKVQFAVAAARGAFEGDDLLRLVADLDGDGAFETTVAQFTPDAAGDLAFAGRKATPIFEDHFVGLGPLLPAGFSGPIRFRVEARTDGGDEELAFDSLRLIGTPDGSGGGTSGLPQPGQTIWLRAQVNGKLVMASEGQPLRAQGNTIGSEDRYAVVAAGGGTVCLRNERTGGFVAAEAAGAEPLVANRGACQGWERFTFVDAGDGAVGLRAQVNGKWVTAEDAGASPLVANRDALRGWERFTWGAVSPSQAGLAVQESAEAPALALTAFPNPASSQATVAFTLPEAADVRVEVVDALGRRVAVLAEGVRAAGRHEAAFDGSGLPAGLYVVRLSAGGQSLTQSITVVR